MRAGSCTGHPVRVRRSHCGEGGVGLGLSTLEGGGGGFVGPMLTSCTSTCWSPVVTWPPVLPPELTLPSVTLVMPPEGGGGVGAGTDERSGDCIVTGAGRSTARALSRASACAKSSGAHASATTAAMTTPPRTDLCAFCVLGVFIWRFYFCRRAR